MFYKLTASLKKVGSCSKMIFVVISVVISNGCSHGIYFSVPTPSSIPTISMNVVATEKPTPIPTIVASPTMPSTYLLDGNSQQEIIFAEFSLDNKGLSITSPFDKWTTQQVVSSQAGLAFYHSPSFSPDGETIIFAYDNGTGFRIYRMNKDGTDLRLLVRSDVILAYQRYPSWSPDSLYIVFTVFNKLYISNSNGSNIKLLTEINGLSYSVWSPDGKRIAFLAGREGNRPGLKIFVIDKDGKNLHALTDAIAGDSKISWSPDGKQIAFRSLDGCGDISTIHLATGAVDTITKTPYIEKDPTWSPDGSYIAFVSSSHTDCEKYAAESSYIPSKLFLADVKSHTILDSMLSDGTETSLYEPSWWPSTVLKSNWKYSVTKAGSNLNIRESPSILARSLIKLKQGAVFIALEGPVDNDDYQWWRIQTSDGIEGWCVDVPGWYMFESAD